MTLTRTALLALIAAITTLAPRMTAAETRQDAWLSALYDRVGSDIAAGAPLVVHAHVPLCDNDIIRCGGHGLGNGDNPATNLYWSTSGGFRGWFGRRGSGWKRVSLAAATAEKSSASPSASPSPSNDVLEILVFTKTVSPTKAWRARGVTKPFRVYVVAQAWRGKAIRQAMDAYVDDLFGTTAKDVTLDDGTIVRAGGAAHIVAYVGHNGWMDIDQYDWAAAHKRAGKAAAAKGTIAVACITADYIAADISAESRVPLLMTKTLLFAGAHSFEGAVSAFAQAGSLTAIRRAAITSYATGQGKTVNQVGSAFTNPSDKRWSSDW